MKKVKSALFVALVMAGCQGVSPPVDTPPNVNARDDGREDRNDGGRDDEAVAEEPAFPLAPAKVIAERLARFLWDEEPDDRLHERLERQTLDRGVLATIADEMLNDPRAVRGVQAFFRWWLLLATLENLEKVDPARVLDSSLRQAMMNEAPAVGAHVTLETKGTYTELLTAPFTFMNERLAKHYGASGVVGETFRKVPYPPGQNRVGLLTGAGVLTMFASLSSPSWPAKRGWLITDQILCVIPIRTLLPPPDLDARRSIREQMITVTASPSCTGCHDLLNSPGFAFIGFDSFGRWRPEAGHGPGETEGWIPRTILADEPRFDGPAELAGLLASRIETSLCFTRFWLQYALSPSTGSAGLRSPAVEQSLGASYSHFAKSGFQLRQLPIAIVRTRAFSGAP
jgi:hypothetical protein